MRKAHAREEVRIDRDLTGCCGLGEGLSLYPGAVGNCGKDLSREETWEE